LHKISHKLVNDSQVQVIAVEDLHIKGMVKNHRLAKSISDAGWGMLTIMLKYKAEKLGKGYIEVNRFYPSTKACSCCGVITSKMPLNIRSWKCDNCSTVHDRDINASKNIALEAKRMIAAGIAGTASRGNVRRGRGRKSSVHAAANEAGNPVL